jgi:hypothetical protein
MSKKIWTGVALAAAVIAMGWWWLERSTRPAPAPSPLHELALQSVAPALPSPPPPVPVETASPPDNLAATRTSDAPVASSGGQPAPEEPLANVLPTAGDILAEPGDDYVKIAQKLGALVLDSRASMENRREALAHTLNLSVGHEAEVLIPLVKDLRLPDELAEDILSEALNRPLRFQADLYVEALVTRTTPELSLRIRRHLAFLTDGPDLGPTSSAWRVALAKAKAGWE